MAKAKRPPKSTENPEENPPEWNEPVFNEDDADAVTDDAVADMIVDDTNDALPFDEPVFDGAPSDQEIEDEAAYDPNEPVFGFDEDDPSADYVPDPQVSERLSVGTSAGGASMLSRQSRGATDSRQATDTDAYQPGAENGAVRERRLGRTGPFWLMGGGLLLVVLLGIWLISLRGGNDESADLQTLTPASGQTENVALPEAEPAETTPPAPATATPIPVLTVGQSVVVANTQGQGIKLRSLPSLEGVTLEIYADGDAFTVLNPDGDYTAYPVEADGYRWYRIQVDGNPDENLTGWAAGDFLTPTE